MTQHQFVATLSDLENIVLKNFRWPTALVVDFEYVEEAFGKANITQYKLPMSGMFVPVKRGQKGEFRFETSDLTGD